MDKDTSLVGKLLLAMPQLADTRFHKAVIIMCAHDENGAMGLVINHPMPGVEPQALLNELKIPSNVNVDTSVFDPILRGGPVDHARGFMLHSSDFSDKDTIKLGSEYGVTGTVEALSAAMLGNGPTDKLLILGYAGWSEGQLEREIQDNSWLVAEPSPALIFSNDLDEKWDKAVGTLGFDPAMLSTSAGHA